MRISWLGWSGFRIETAGRTVLLDAHWGGLEEVQPTPPPGWGVGADVLAVSHGHYDHCGVVPELLRRNPGAPFVSTRPVVEFARRRWELDEGRAFVSPWSGSGLAIDHLPGIHVQRSAARAASLLARWTAKRPGAMRVLSRQRDDSPSMAPVQAVRVASGEGTVLHACEVLHRRTDLRQAEGWLGGRPLDVLIAGVEPGEERAVLRGVTALRPRRVLLFSPHQLTRDWFDGSRAAHADLAGLAGRVRDLRWHPGCHVPGQDEPLDLDLGAEAADSAADSVA